MKKKVRVIVCSLIVLGLVVIGGGVFAANYYYSKLDTTAALKEKKGEGYCL